MSPGHHRGDRPPQTVTTAREVAATNSTLNSFLGGRRKSWMETTRPIQPSPRPPRPQNPSSTVVSNQEQPPQHIAPPQASPPAASLPSKCSEPNNRPDQPRHQKPSSASSPNHTSSQSSAGVLPSPAPSDEPSPAVSTGYDSPTCNMTGASEVANAEVESDATTGLSEAIRSTEPHCVADLTTQTDPHPTQPFPDSTPQAPPNPPLNIHSRGQQFAQARHFSGASPPVDSPGVVSPPVINNVHNFTAQPSPALSSRRVSAIHSRDSSVDGSRHTDQQHGQRGPSAKRRRTEQAFDLPYDTSTSLSTFPQRPPQPAQQTAPPPFDQILQRQPQIATQSRTQPFYLVDRIHELSQKIHPNERCGLYFSRLVILSEACVKQDFLFLAIHQAFCLWSHQSPILPNLIATPRVDAAFKILEIYIRPNTPPHMNPDHLLILSQFPTEHSLKKAGFSTEDYNALFPHVSVFLDCLARRHDALRQRWNKRGYPPLVDEFLTILRLPSPTLQTVMFRSSRKLLTGLSPDDNQITPQLDELFAQDQGRHQDELGRMHIGAEMDQDTLEANNQDLWRQYQPLITHLVQLSYSQQQQARRPSQQSSIVAQQHLPSQGVQYGHPAYSRRPSFQQAAQQVAQPARSSPHQQQVQQAQMVNQQQSMPLDQQQYQQALLLAQGQQQQNQEQQQRAFVQQYRQLQPASQQHQQQMALGHQYRQQYQQQTVAVHPQPHQNIQMAHQQAHQQAQVLMVGPHHVSPTSHDYIQSPPILSPGHFPPTSGLASGSPVQSPQAQGPPVFSTFAPSPPQPLTQSSYTSPYGTNAPQPQIQNQQHGGSPEVQYAQFQRLVSNPSVGSYPNATFAAPGMARATRSPTASNTNLQQTPINAGAHQTRVLQRSGRNVTPALKGSAGRFIPAIRDPPIQASLIPHDQYERSSVMASLHQVLERSPDRKPARPVSTTQGRYYQYVKELVREPAPLLPNGNIHVMEFLISPESFRNIVEPVMLAGSRIPVCCYGSGSLRYRVKVIQARKGSSAYQHEWVVADPEWPKHVFVKVNETFLQPRRKAQHSKDLPLELDKTILKPGQNELQISLPRSSNVPKGFEYRVAIEVVETRKHQDLIMMVTSKRVMSAEASRLAIQRRISGVDLDDDDVALVTSDLPIDLADPWSATIWNIPVRGQSCTHLECFDLETWLTSRPTKPCRHGKSPLICSQGCPTTEPTLVDRWKCPTCDGDARPLNLVVDGFLLEIRGQLEKERNLKSVRSIWVSAEGTWRPKTIQEDGPDDSDNEPTSSKTTPAPTQQVVDIIELD
ncbi:hypothetical protein MKZ38_002180 [Zalerion maritima]|uniref:SP-RING-type domain-containing protein n=1 Tax=Zalerion maritima TaxID=339359 RepID=A0AAD5WQZ9_9PEZI|nr:hypothetical protein MKZ38_002180 [Zalerion maritima]